MKFKDIKGDLIYVMWKCGDEQGYHEDDWQCKIFGYVRDPAGSHKFFKKRKSGVYDQYLREDYEAEEGPPFFNCTMFIDRKYSKNEILLAAQVHNLTPLYSFNLSKRDIKNDYYLFIADELGPREFRKLKLEIE